MQLRLYRRTNEARLFWLQSEGQLNELWTELGGADMISWIAANYPSKLVTGQSSNNSLDVYREHNITAQDLTLLLIRYPQLLDYYVLVP